MKKEKVTIIGSGNWGTAIAKVIGKNILGNPKLTNYEKTVDMWVYEEILSDGETLSDTINKIRENVKYLPYVTIPENIYANPSLEESIKEATVLVFVLPHQFLDRITSEIKKILPPQKLKSLKIITLIKGIFVEKNKCITPSEKIASALNIPLKNVAVLSGGNIANDIAMEAYANTTIASKDNKLAKFFKQLFQNKKFRVEIREEQLATEYLGALKNILAIGNGFAESMHYLTSTKAAITLEGVHEMIRFMNMNKLKFKDNLFLESCGLADLLVTFESGRNNKFAQKYVKYNKDKFMQSIDFIEKKYFDGQKIQGTHTLKSIYSIIQKNKQEKNYPLFKTLYQILYRKEPIVNFAEKVILGKKVIQKKLKITKKKQLKIKKHK